MRKYQIKLETDSKKLEFQARELIALRLKNRALLVLKLRKFKQKELDGIDSKLLSIQSQIRDVEWASINVSILKAIESGTQELNRIHEQRSLEDVQALMDDTNEAIEVIRNPKSHPLYLASLFLIDIVGYFSLLSTIEQMC